MPCSIHFSAWKDLAPHCLGGWVGPSAILDSAESLVPTSGRILYRPACSELL